MNTTDYLLQVGKDDDIVLITEDTTYTYQDLKSSTEHISNKLLEYNVQPGDRVGLLSANSLFWIASYLAIMKIGAVVVPFATVLMPDELNKMEQFVRCKALCLQKKYHSKYANSLRNDLFLVLDNTLLDIKVTHHKPKASFPLLDIEQEAALMFTSGTTSRPKAVRITHQNIQANTDSIIDYLDLTSEDRIMVVLPFFYCFGTSLLHTHLRVGGSLVVSNRFAFPEITLDLVQEYNCTGFAGVPSTYHTLLKNTTFPKRKFRTLNKIQQAGGKLQDVLIDELLGAIPDAQIYIMYGQTEATARLSYLPPNMIRKKIGSIGKGIPGVELCVLDTDGKKIKPNEEGEIIARGDNISKGYLNDPEATARKFRDGVLYTGDIATVDEDGFIYIMDRERDFIKSYGYRVSSQ